MIAHIRGTLDEIRENAVVLETAGGVGYEIFVSGSVLQTLPVMGSEMKLFTYHHIKEDEASLYGFLDKDERAMFQLLISVSGIGPKGAMNMLSGISADDLRFAILSEDTKTIAKAPGIGAKTANRLVVELKDKLSIGDAFAIKTKHTQEQNKQEQNKQEQNKQSKSPEVEKEAVLALEALGYAAAEAYKMVRAVDSDQELDVETLVKEALRQIF